MIVEHRAWCTFLDGGYPGSCDCGAAFVKVIPGTEDAVPRPHPADGVVHVSNEELPWSDSEYDAALRRALFHGRGPLVVDWTEVIDR